jgi:hypothetical protein
MRETKVDGGLLHRQNGLNLSAWARKAGRRHVGPGFQPAAGF